MPRQGKVNPKLLQLLIQSILSTKGICKQDRYLYATAISLAYFGYLRAGELSYPSVRSYNPKQHLTVRDITIHNNTVQLWIKHSKTDQLGKGATIIIGPSKTDTCPVLITQQFLHFRRHVRNTDALFCFQYGSLLTRPRLQAMLRKSITCSQAPSGVIWDPQPAHWICYCSCRSRHTYEHHQSHGPMVQRLLSQLHQDSTQNSEKPN